MKILLVTEFNRKDFLHSLDGIGNIELVVMGASFPWQVKNKPTVEHYYWYQFNSAFDLLDRIKPDKIVFHHYQSIHEVGLIMACEIRNIPTFHLEHGARNYEHILNKKFHRPQTVKRKSKLSKLRPGQFFKRLANRKFIERTLDEMPDSHHVYYQTFIEMRRKENSISVFRILEWKHRLPDLFISFSPKAFDFHRKVNEFDDEQPVKYIGIPSIDGIFIPEINANPEQTMIYIDQPLVEDGTLGWTFEEKEKRMRLLGKWCEENNYRLLVKTHPRNDMSFWNDNVFEILNTMDELKAMIPKASVVVGYYSTLLLPLMAYEHLTCISMNFHPLKLNAVEGDFFSETGCIEPTYSEEELMTALDNIQDLKAKQGGKKQEFVEEWMYKFDGRAGERLKDILNPAG